MRKFFFFLIFVFSSARAMGATELLVQALYSDDFKTRSQAAQKLSSSGSQEEISKIIRAFDSELLCTKKKPRPKTCHDPKFIYNAILVAGNLSARSHEAPWNFLVHLWKGTSNSASQEGTFFSQSKDPEQDHRENTFVPSNPNSKPTRGELQSFLLETIKKAEIWASCEWPLDKLTKLSKKKTVSDYQIYSFDRNYSPDLQPQYQNRNNAIWIYQGERRISCNTVSDLFIDARTNELFGFSIKDVSGESLELETSLFRFPQVNLLCSYVIRHEGADPLNASTMKAEKFFQTFFDYNSKNCRPKKVPGYEFNEAPRN